MVEQVYLYRLRVADSQATLDLLRYQAGDLVRHADRPRERRVRAGRGEAPPPRGAADEARRPRREGRRVAGSSAAAPSRRCSRRSRATRRRGRGPTGSSARRRRRSSSRSPTSGGRRTRSRRGPDGAARSRRSTTTRSGTRRRSPRSTRGRARPRSRTSCPGRRRGAAAVHRAPRDRAGSRAQPCRKRTARCARKLRERQRAARAEAAALGPDEIEAARLRRRRARGRGSGIAAGARGRERVRVAEAEGGAREAPRRAARGAPRRIRPDARRARERRCSRARSLRESNLLRYRSALLWTRDPSEISAESRSTARAPISSPRPRRSRAPRRRPPGRLGTGSFPRSGTGAGSISEWSFGALLLAGALLVAVHRRRDEGRRGRAGGRSAALTLGRAATIGATLLRNVELDGAPRVRGRRAAGDRGGFPARPSRSARPSSCRRSSSASRGRSSISSSAPRARNAGSSAARGSLRASSAARASSSCGCAPASFRSRSCSASPGTATATRASSSSCGCSTRSAATSSCSACCSGRRASRRWCAGKAEDRLARTSSAPSSTAAYPFVIAAVIFLLVLRSLSYRVAVALLPRALPDLGGLDRSARCSCGAGSLRILSRERAQGRDAAGRVGVGRAPIRGPGAAGALRPPPAARADARRLRPGALLRPRRLGPDGRGLGRGLQPADRASLGT